MSRPEASTSTADKQLKLRFDMALQSGRTYKLVNGKAGTVLDLSGADNRQTVGYGYHSGDNQKVRGELINNASEPELTRKRRERLYNCSGSWRRRKRTSGSCATSRQACTSRSRARLRTARLPSRSLSPPGGPSRPTRRTPRPSGALPRPLLTRATANAER